jgi:hypothetical protein
MAIPNGRRGAITDRDEALIRDLFFCRYETTSMLAEQHFGSQSGARRRLNQLKHKGYLGSRLVYTTPPTKNHPGERETVWHLTKDAFEMVAVSLGREDERWSPKQLGPENTRHHVRTAEVYVAAKADLDALLGLYPNWEWRHEARAREQYEYRDERGERTFAHEPDAHVLFLDHAFIVERQTAASRVKPSDVYAKVAAHATYARVVLKKPDAAEVLFACDERRVAEAARRAGEQYGIHVFAGTPREAAFHLYQSALRLTPDEAADAFAEAP